jgi:hypothetical protein
MYIRFASYGVGIAILSLLGCANVTTKLVDNAGHERYCYLKHQGSWDAIPANEQYNMCLNAAGKDGFKIVK